MFFSQKEQIERLKNDLEITETEMIRLLNESADKDIKIDSLKASCNALNKQIQESKFWENLSTFWRIIAVALLIVCLKAIFSPVSHRLSPDIGSQDDEYGREGQVTGFHYEKKTWWGFRKQVYDEVRFVKHRGPQYLDGNEWQDVPEEAWGNAVVDDRAMEMDNRGWHEQ